MNNEIYNKALFNYIYNFNSNPVFKCVKSSNGTPCIETAEPEKQITVIHNGNESKTYPSKKQGQRLYEVAIGDYILRERIKFPVFSVFQRNSHIHICNYAYGYSAGNFCIQEYLRIFLCGCAVMSNITYTN